MASDNFTKRRFIRAEHAKDDYSKLTMTDIENI